MHHPLAFDLVSATDKVKFIEAYKDELATCLDCGMCNTSRTFASTFHFKSSVMATLCDVESNGDDLMLLILQLTPHSIYMGGELMRQLFAEYFHLAMGNMKQRFVREQRPVQHHFGLNRFETERYWLDLYAQPRENLEFEIGLNLGLSDQAIAQVISALFFEGRGDFSAFQEEDPFGHMLFDLSHCADEQILPACQFTHLVLTKHTNDALDSVIDRWCTPLMLPGDDYEGRYAKFRTDVLGQFCTMLQVQEHKYETQLPLKRQIVTFVRYLLQRGCRPFREVGDGLSAYAILIRALSTLRKPNPAYLYEIQCYTELLQLYMELQKDMERIRERWVFKTAPVWDEKPVELLKRICSFV
jgi:hypothetical protein